MSEASISTQTMPEVHVQAERLDARTYDRAEIDATPEGNRDLTSLIATHPAVRLNPTMDGNGNRGSLAPESFSIHGESPYQNLFLIDGINATNSINPQESQLGLQVGRVPGYSQSYNIDTDLLDQVQVFDNRVPVEFGGFQGGVIDAKIKKPQGTNRFSVKRSFNSSKLTQQQMPERVVDDWNNGEPGYAAEWRKHFSSIQGDVRLTEDSAALLSFSRRESKIQRQSLQLDPTAAIPNGKNSLLVRSAEDDTVDNFLGKLHTRWGGGTESNLVLKYADRQEDLVSNGFANSGWTNQQKSLGVSVELLQQLDSGKLSATLGLDQKDARRDSDTRPFTVQRFADKSLLSYTSGGFGLESLDERQYTGKLRMDWNTFATGAVQHKLYAGLNAQSTDASFVRHQTAYTVNQTLQADGSQSITTRNRYDAGTVDVGLNQTDLYVSDTMQLGNWAWTVGSRVERDNLLKNTNWAPRTRLDWDVLGDGRTQAGLGWSRYYGLNLLGHALEEGKSRLLMLEIQKGNPINRPGKLEHHYSDGLKTPHSDEWAFNLSHQLSPMLEVGLSYVHRTSRDGVTTDGNSTTGYFHTNGAWGRSETATFSLRTLKPWKAAGADWTGRLDFSWQDTFKNHDSSQAWEAEGEAPDSIVEIDGVQMLFKDAPYVSFIRPRELAVSTRAHWQQAGITWGNRLEWKSGRDAYIFAGSSKGVTRFRTDRLASYMTWDTSLTYQPAQVKGLTLELNVLNVLNKQVPIAVGRATAANNARYQIGREIWLTAGYAF